MTNIGGERRFAAQLAQRLQHLGALTKGDRRAADAADLSQFDFQTRYGRKALERLVDSVRRRSLGVGRPMKLVRAVLGYDVSEEESDEKWEAHCEDVETALMTVGFDLTNPGATKGERERALNVKQFLNRLLGLATTTQNRCFRHFTAMFDDEIARDKSEGRYDDGVVDLKGSSIELKRSPIPFYTDPTTKARTTLFTITVDRGMDWQRAIAEYNAAQEREDAAAAEAAAAAALAVLVLASRSVAILLVILVAMATRWELRLEKVLDDGEEPPKVFEPFFARLLESLRHTRLAGGLQPDNHALALCPGFPRQLHDRRHLHRHQQLLEEALVSAPELRHCVRRRLPAVHLVDAIDGGLEALLHRLPKLCAPVVQPALLGAQLHLDRLKGGVLVRERP